MTDSPKWSDATIQMVEGAFMYGGPAEVLRQLADAGLLVVGEFEQPDPDTLYARYRPYARARAYGGVTFRWVMCRETLDYLSRTVGRRQFEVAQLLDPAVFDRANGLAVNVPTGDTPARLFGVDIRVDPAARRVMVELAD